MKRMLAVALLISASIACPAVAQTPPTAPGNAPNTDAVPGEDADTLHGACVPAPGLSGSEQSMSLADTEGLQHQSEGNDKLLSAMSAMQVQMKLAIAREDIDLAFACSLLAFHRGIVRMAQVHAEYGQDEAVKSTVQQFIAEIEDERQKLVRWLEQRR